MKRIKYFLRSVNVVNGLILMAVGAVVYFIVIPFVNPVVELSTAKIKMKQTATASSEKETPVQNETATDYTLINDQNLFHPERKLPPEKKPEAVVPKPDVFLYGTLITDQESFAFIEDKRSPHTTPGRGKRQTTLKKGDSLNGYILQEVNPNRIVFVKGEERVIATLDDASKKRAVDAAASPAGPVAAPGGMPSLPSSGHAPPLTAPLPGSGAVPPKPSAGVLGARQFGHMIAPSAPQAASPGAAGGSDTRPMTRRERVEAGKLLRFQRMQQTTPQE